MQGHEMFPYIQNLSLAQENFLNFSTEVSCLSMMANAASLYRPALNKRPHSLRNCEVDHMRAQIPVSVSIAFQGSSMSWQTH